MTLCSVNRALSLRLRLRSLLRPPVLKPSLRGAKNQHTHASPHPAKTLRPASVPLPTPPHSPGHRSPLNSEAPYSLRAGRTWVIRPALISWQSSCYTMHNRAGTCHRAADLKPSGDMPPSRRPQTPEHTDRAASKKCNHFYVKPAATSAAAKTSGVRTLPLANEPLKGACGGCHAEQRHRARQGS